MITIDYQSRAPIYEQVVDRFEQLILSGVLAPGDQMPSVRSLAISLSINPNTIQKAYLMLEQRGYIFSVKGKGSFIADIQDAATAKKQEYLNELRSLLREASMIGIEPSHCHQIVDEVFGIEAKEE